MATPEENHQRAVWTAFMVLGTHAIVDGPGLMGALGRLQDDREVLLRKFREFLPEEDSFRDDTHRYMVIAAMFALGFNDARRKQAGMDPSQN